MGEVKQFRGATTVALSAEQVLEVAKQAGLDRVLVIGRTNSGVTYYAMSHAEVAETLLDIEIFKAAMLNSL